MNSPSGTAPYPFPTRKPRPRVHIRRYYSSPLNDEIPDSTPLQVFGLVQRSPSVTQKQPRLINRMSYALGDIKEELDPRLAADKIRKRTSVFMFDGANLSQPTLLSPPQTHPEEEEEEEASVRPQSSHPPPPSSSRPNSLFSMDLRKPRRRLSMLRGSFIRRKGPQTSQSASISTPNLIGSSNGI
ncbi:hypothetical protein ASPZODRAFT_135171 [Penicilliopsis zonata CBS 506.65]|uniref:Uncharacterized protein n=1 Tax=Penicilliopsis zonata CBS 506.65 TaxID=1073090 RepID=A0A1L9SB04_9EURO|nr:hypothetical protein ASPZODRAFT_135171 [Penicilliopsis zonata CBS 506.65]OJJ44360.1 hypothetical protein ASPZODRAFT_135171 [Penicilliopsis zonata CBS 506.65]